MPCDHMPFISQLEGLKDYRRGRSQHRALTAPLAFVGGVNGASHRLHSPLNPTRRDDACRSRPAVRPLTRLSPAVYHRNCLGIQKKN